MERSILGVSLIYRMQNENIHRRGGVDHFLRRRLNYGRWTKKILEWLPREDKQGRGRPPTR